MITDIPFPVTPVVAFVQHVNTNYVQLPKPDTNQFFVLTWPDSTSPNVVEYMITQSYTLTPWTPFVTNYVSGNTKVFPLPTQTTFFRVDSINANGISSYEQR